MCEVRSAARAALKSRFAVDHNLFHYFRGEQKHMNPEASSSTAAAAAPAEAKCPFAGATRPHTNREWWPNQLDLRVLHQHSNLSNPMGEEFDYAQEFNSLDLNAVVKDLHALMTDSQDW
jgi:catalase (peroxidase I)